jgi:cell division transport system permease protein
MRISCSVRQALARIVVRWRRRLAFIVCIALGFLVLDLFLLFGLNLRKLEGEVKGQVQMEVYLNDDITSLQLHMLLQSLKRLQAVKQVEYRSPGNALVQMQDFLGTGISEGLGAGALPASLLLSLESEYRGFEQVAGLATRLSKQEGVEDVEFGETWLRQADRNIHVLFLGVIVFGIIMIVTLVTILANFMRWELRSETQIVQAMRLLGASRGDVSFFLMIQGLLLGGVGAFGGIVCLWIVHSAFTRAVSSIDFLPAPGTLALIAGGTILGMLASYLWSRSHLSFKM